MNILLDEDDRPLREALGAFLRSSGHRVIEAADYGSALRAIDGSVDLLLSDLRLPDGTGPELIAKARAHQPMINILMMTGFGTIPTAFCGGISTFVSASCGST